MSGKPSKLLNKLSGPVSEGIRSFLHAFAEPGSHKAGQLKEAERFYKKAFRSSLFMRQYPFPRRIASQTRNYEKAIELIGKAIAIDPAQRLSFQLGNALR